MEKHDLPGISLAVIQGEEVIFAKGYGTAGSEAVSPQTLFLIGSQSKSFTALGIAILADEGKIDLNAPVRTYIPWFTVADADASERITIRHLLRHTSGLSESGFGKVLPADLPLEDMIRSLKDAELTAPVGTQFQYFNLGYDILAYVIEVVSGQSYAAFVRERILDPLEMSSTTAEVSELDKRAQGYSRLFGFPLAVRQVIREYEIAAGFILSNAEDMAKYAVAMKRLVKKTEPMLLSREMSAQMFTPGIADYGFGWWISDGGSRIYHGGANEAYHAEVVLYPNLDRAVVYLINEGYFLDHTISIEQLKTSINAILQGSAPPPVSQGWSVRWVGWGIGVLVAGLLVLHTFNFLALRGWRKRVRTYKPLKLAFDVAISFIIPTLILLVIFSQMKAYFGNRFNLVTTLYMMRFTLPDVFILMLVGSLPDYLQGLYKVAALVFKK
jgi:CubicO group peptidase (beta-lactamase class C family)